MKRVFIVALATAILSSCAGFTHVTVPSSSISYVGKDIETERYVEYTLTKSYFFGIGGMSAKARNTNIVKELMRKANLQENEALAYISVSKNVNTFLGIITYVNFKGSGYVVRPVGQASSVKATSNQEEHNVKDFQTTGGILLVSELSDRIYYARTGEELLKIKEEIMHHMNSGALSDKSAEKLLKKIERNTRL